MNTIIRHVVGAIVILGVLGGVAVKLHNDGVQEERARQLTKGVELVMERDKLDASIKRTATPADACRRLGGKWLPDTNQCS